MLSTTALLTFFCSKWTGQHRNTSQTILRAEYIILIIFGQNVLIPAINVSRLLLFPSTPSPTPNPQPHLSFYAARGSLFTDLFLYVLTSFA